MAELWLYNYWNAAGFLPSKPEYLDFNYSAPIYPIGYIFLEKYMHIISSYWTKFHDARSFKLMAIGAAAEDKY